MLPFVGARPHNPGMAPKEEFESQEVLRAPVSPDELRIVLHDLSEDEIIEQKAKKELPPDHVTAEAIAEALSIEIQTVYAAIARVRRNDVREHVSKVLSELEEPTHSVERPGHCSDPLLSNYNFRRESAFSSVLDKLPKHGEQQAPPRVDQKPTLAERLLLYFFVTGLVGTVAYAAVQIVQQLR